MTLNSPLKRLLTGLSTAAVTLLAAGTLAAADARYVLVSHAPDSDTWWNTVKNSIVDAGKDFNVTVDYRNPPNGDLADMARIIEQSAARNYDGVIFDIADFDVLKKPAEQVRAKNIPIITINSGTVEQSKQLGALMHVGQPEYAAGKAAGERAKAAGIKSYVCVNHYATNASSFDRSRGYADALGIDFKPYTLDTGIDPTTVENKVSAYLRAHPDTQSVLALGPDSAAPTLAAMRKAGIAGKMYFGTFDLSPDITKGIKDGSINYAIDQQPYLQGYIPVAVFAIMKRENTKDIAKVQEILKADPKFQKRLEEYGLKPIYEANNIASGPGFVTKENVEKVEKYAGEYR